MEEQTERYVIARLIGYQSGEQALELQFTTEKEPPIGRDEEVLARCQIDFEGTEVHALQEILQLFELMPSPSDVDDIIYQAIIAAAEDGDLPRQHVDWEACRGNESQTWEMIRLLDTCMQGEITLMLDIIRVQIGEMLTKYLSEQD